jgi:hypothetical protein
VTVRAVAARAGDAVAPAFFVLYAAGFLISAFTQLDQLRASLVGDAAVAGWAPGLLVATLSALAWRGLALRRWRWLAPAELTWRDAGDRRVLAVRRRLLASWSLRLVAVLYVWAWAGALAGLPTPWWIAGTATAVAVGLAVLYALWPAPPGRAELIEGWRERGVRRVAMRFLDPLLLVGAARPLALSLAGASLVRFLALEGIDRGSGPVHAALLLLVAVAVLQLAPALPATTVLGVLGYVATLPVANGLARVWPVPGLRRWMPVSDRRLRLTAGALVAVSAGIWAIAVSAVTGAAIGPPTVVAVAVLVAVAVVRTLARPPLVIDSTSAVVLVIRTLRGIDVLAVGTVLLVALGLR